MVRPPSAGLPAPGSTAGLLTHGLCGLALLLQLPLQAGDLRLEVTCFCGSRERQALQRLPGPGGRFMPSAARTMIGHLGGALGRCWQAWPLHPAFSWAAVPCLHLPGLPYPPGGATGRLRKGSSLPQLPQASRPPRGLARCEAQGCVSLPDGFCGGQRGASAGWGYQGGRSSQEFPSVTHRYEPPAPLPLWWDNSCSPRAPAFPSGMGLRLPAGWPAWQARPFRCLPPPASPAHSQPRFLPHP